MKYPWGPGNTDKRIHATEFPGAYVFTGYIGGVIHDVRVAHGDDTVGFFRVPVRSQHGDNMMRYRLGPARYSIPIETVFDDLL